jgi:ATP-binding cassette subfamily B protein
MRKAVRQIVAVIALSLRADPLRAVGYYLLFSGAAVGGLISPYLLKLLTDAALQHDATAAVRYAVGMALASAASLLAAWTGVALLFTLIENASRYLDQRLIALSASVTGVEHHELPEYLDRIQLLRSHRGILSSSSQVFSQTTEVLISAVGTGILLGRVSPWLLLLPLCGVPSLVAGIRSERHRQRVVDETAEGTRRARHLFELATSSAAGKELRIFGLGRELVRRHEADWREVDGRLDRAALRATLLTGGGWAIFAIGYGLALLLVVDRAAHGSATPGDVVMALALVARVNQLVQGLVGLAGYFALVFSVGGRYLWLVDFAQESAARSAGRVEPPPRLRDGISLEQVTFRYPGTERDVLRDVTLHLPAGSTIALVGDNGAGKSTLVKLLCRFYEPTAGRITVDGIELADLDVAEWRRRMAAGFQDFAKFELLAREVVGVGDLGSLEDPTAVEGARAVPVAPT